MQGKNRLKFGVFAPSGTFLCADGTLDLARLDRSIALLRASGSVTRFSVRSVRTRFAGSDKERQEAFACALKISVDGLIALRGGFGAQMLLSVLAQSHGQYPAICGFSDVTVLINASWVWHDRVGYLSPMVGDWGRANMQDYCTRFCRTIALAKMGKPWVRNESVQTIYYQGKKQDFVDFDREEKGRLWGGNLTMLTTLMGTNASPVARLSQEDNILLIEEVGESAYRIERMIRHLAQAHALQRTKVVFFGDCGQTDRYAALQGGYTLDRALMRLSKRYPRIYWCTGLAMGHARQRGTYPVGQRVRMTLTQRSVTMRAIGRTTC